MKIFIKQDSDLPYIEIPLNNIKEKYNLTEVDFQKCVATFSMYDVKNNMFVIANNSADIFAKKRVVIIDEENDYYLRYKLSKEDTKISGNFIGEFKIDFLHNECGTVTIPNGEKLHVIINKSITKTSITYSELQPLPSLVPIPTWYYGKYSVIGGVVDIPDGLDILLSSGNIVTTVNPNSNLYITYNSNSNDFIWFAIPVTSTSKKSWYIDQYNYGYIGGIKNINGNLFPDPEIVTYNNINYRLYISNYRVTLSTIKISNT